jgi:hypothetical protein
MAQLRGDRQMSARTTATAAGPAFAVQILHVPDCPNVERLRTRVQRSLARLGLPATIEELEGPYPSPTLLINGLDVIRPAGNSEASCRLDLPTEEQIIEALGNAPTST